MIWIANIAACTEEMLRPHVGAERIEYAAKYKQPMDRIRALGVAVLADIACSPEGVACGDDPAVHTPVRILHDEKQRPYLVLPDATQEMTAADRQGIAVGSAQMPQISLSHAGDYVAVATDRLPVGIDIEQIRPCKESLAERFFSDAERAYMEQLQGAAAGSDLQGVARDLAFTAIWTLKESFLKATGMGLSLGLESFSMEYLAPEGLMSDPGQDKVDTPEWFRVRQSFDDNTYFGVLLPAPEGYQLSVCFHNNSETERLIQQYKQGELVHEICLSALLS